MDEIPTTAIDELRGKLKGPLLQERDPDYDACRAVWNARFDRRPALIARCTGVADVIQAVSFARSRTLPISVRSGGHHITGDAVGDGGVMLDMSLMKGVRVDPAARTA